MQIQIEIESQSSSTGIIFPNTTAKGNDRENQHSVKTITNANIEEAVRSALQKAKNSIEHLGMKDLLVQSDNWDNVSFGDVGDVEENYGEDLVEENDDNVKDDGKIEVQEMDGQKEMDIPTESQLSVRECKDIMEELEVMYRNEIIDQPLKKQINFVCRKKINNADIDGSDESTIPLYKPVEQTTTSNDKPTKMRLDQRFLEVIHNARSLIQMTIAYTQISKAYICTLSEGCFSKVQHTCTEVNGTIINHQSHSNLYTARELTIKKDTASFIHNCINTTIGASITKQNYNNEIVVLSSDDGSNNMSNVIPLWVTHGKHKLTIKDKHLIETGKQLTDTIVNFASGLLKKQFPHFGGFQSTLLQKF